MKYLLVCFVFVAAAFCAADSAFDATALYGKWIVVGSFDSSGVSALSTEEHRAMRGKAITIAQSKFQIGDKICSNPGYEVSVIPRDELLRSVHYADSKESGLPSTVRQIDAGCVDIFIRNEKSILFLWGGNIFVANRK
jgi:hypothetical protein